MWSKARTEFFFPELNSLVFVCLRDFSQADWRSLRDEDSEVEAEAELESSSLDTDIDPVNWEQSGKLDRLPDRFFSLDFLSRMYSGLQGRGSLTWSMDTANIGDVRTGVGIFFCICFFFCSSPRLLCSFRTSLSVTELILVLASCIRNNTNCYGVMVWWITWLLRPLESWPLIALIISPSLTLSAALLPGLTRLIYK